jgi:DNA-nicking Smr family endonuclease
MSRACTTRHAIYYVLGKEQVTRLKRKRHGTSHPRFDSSDPLLDAAAAAELDLHGCTAEDARAMVQGFLEGWRRRGGGVVVTVITGRGGGSMGPPVLGRVVAALLKGPLRPLVAEWAEDDSGGAVKVRVR